MKPIRRTKNFEKHFRLRISADKKLRKQFMERLELFISGERGYPLSDHPLKGNMVGKRSFSVANDLRVIYFETDDEYVFIDVGSHAQVYK